jgi:hypothetical protein
MVVKRSTGFVCVAVAVIALAGGGCSSVKKVRTLFGGMLPMQVEVAKDVNERSPVAVDLLVVYDAKLVEELLKVPSTGWFAGREQYLKDHAKAISVQSWEWVPGQPVEPVTIEYRIGARKVILFADYRTAGEHRLAIEPQQPFRLVLRANDLVREDLQ